MKKQFIKLVVTEFKLFLREPEAVFFSFIFPVFFLFLTMEVFIPPDALKAIVINYTLPALMVLSITLTAIFGLPATIVAYRETKFFKRLKATPVSPVVVLGGLGIANFIMTLIGLLLLVIGGNILYQAQFEGNIIVFFSGFLLSLFSLISMGLVIVSLCRTVRKTTIVSEIVFFPMMFFSGVFVPINQFPGWISNYNSPFIPLTHSVKLLQGLWLGEPMADFVKEVLILMGVLIIGIVISEKTFRWE